MFRAELTYSLGERAPSNLFWGTLRCAIRRYFIGRACAKHQHDAAKMITLPNACCVAMNAGNPYNAQRSIDGGNVLRKIALKRFTT